MKILEWKLVGWSVIKKLSLFHTHGRCRDQQHRYENINDLKMLSRRVKKPDLVNSTQSSSTPSQNARSLGMAGRVCPAVKQRPVYFNKGRGFCCRHLLSWPWKKKDNSVHIAYYRFNSFSNAEGYYPVWPPHKTGNSWL